MVSANTHNHYFSPQPMRWLCTTCRRLVPFGQLHDHAWWECDPGTRFVLKVAA